MSTSEANAVPSEEVEEGEDQVTEEQGEVDQDIEEENEVASEDEAQPIAGAKRKRERKEPIVLVRDEGKSLLPFARVQKIIKADKVCGVACLDHSLCLIQASGHSNHYSGSGVSNLPRY